MIKYLFPANKFMLGFDPLTLGAITVGSGLLSGLFGSGESDQEKALKNVLDKLDQNQGFFKSTPFTKEELFNTILPAIQQTQRGAADVAAGRLGSAIGEASGVAGGQGAMDYYIQNLAPVIAQGEQNAAQSYKQFTELWSQMDENAKRNFLAALQTEANVGSGLPNMSKAQKFFTNFLSGAQLGSTAYGNVSQGLALAKQGDMLTQIAGNMQGQSLQAPQINSNYEYPTVNILQGGL